MFNPVLYPPASVMAKFAHLPRHMQLPAAQAYQALSLSPLLPAEIQRAMAEISKEI